MTSATTASVKRGLMRALAFIEEDLPALLMAVIVVALAADVVGRYVFSSPVQSASEIALIAFIWLTYLAVAAASRKGQHIAIDVLTSIFSRRWQAIVEILVQVIALLVTAYLIINGLDYFLNGNFVDLTGTGMSRKFLELAIPVSATFLLVYASRDLVRAVKGAITGEFERTEVVDEEIDRIDESYLPENLK